MSGSLLVGKKKCALFSFFLSGSSWGGISQILDFSRRVTIVIKRPCCELVHQEWLTTARSHTVASCDERGLACAIYTYMRPRVGRFGARNPDFSTA